MGASPKPALQGEGDVAWLQPGTWGLGYGNLAEGSMTILMATASLPSNFLTHGEPCCQMQWLHGLEIEHCCYRAVGFQSVC